MPAPERAVPVAEVCELGAVERVGGQHEHLVPGSAQPGEVGRTAALHVARAFDEVRAVLERFNEPVHLSGIGAAVGVDHHDDVALGGSEPRPQRGPLAALILVNDNDVGTQFPREVFGAVGGQAVDDHQLMDPFRQVFDHPGEAFDLVQGGDDHGHLGTPADERQASPISRASSVVDARRSGVTSAWPEPRPSIWPGPDALTVSGSNRPRL